MCEYKTLKNMPHGQVCLCGQCNRLQVAFCTTVVSFSREQFYDFITTVDTLYKQYNLHLCRDKKMVHVPLPAKGVAMICSINELKVLLYLLVEGRNSLEYEEIFTFSKN